MGEEQFQFCPGSLHVHLDQRSLSGTEIKAGWMTTDLCGQKLFDVVVGLAHLRGEESSRSGGSVKPMASYPKALACNNRLQRMNGCE